MPAVSDIRPLLLSDVPTVLEIQSACPQTSQWSAADYALAMDGGYGCAVALSRKTVVGFIVSRLAADELEILNLAVDPAHRRRGLARRLLAAALDRAVSRGTRSCFLEVRATNSGAISFYLHNGFMQTGRRPAYYSNPPADALLLSRRL